MRGFAKIFFMLCVMFVALSCVDAVEGLDVSEGEICMSPVLSDMTKTRAGGDTNPYPDGSSFGAFAYYNQTQPYFENHKFTSESGVCAGDDPVYWPLSGSLIFAGYSPYEAGANTAFNPVTKTLTINDYTVDGKSDLMYFLPELSDGNYVGYDKSTASVPVKFYHALSCVSINVAVKSGDKANVKLKSITLKDVYTQGDFTVNASDPTSGTWGGLTAENDIILHSSDTYDGTDLSLALDLKCFTIPGSASAIEIVYLDRDVEKSHSITPAEHIAVWDQGLRYQYNITLSGLEPVVIDKNKVSVSIDHIYQSGTTLAGSQVNLNLGNLENLGLTSEQLARIKNLTVSVKKNGVTYKQKTFDSISSNSNSLPIILSITEGDKFYLPYKLGAFDVVCTYNDGIEDRSLTLTASAPAPIFHVTIDFLATSTYITINSAKVSISESVLKEVRLSGNGGAMITFIGGQTLFDFTTDDSSLSSPTFMSAKTKSASTNDGQYTLLPYLQFDNQTITSATLVTSNKYTTSNNQTFYVNVETKKYKRSTQITKSQNLQGGKMYVICANWATSRYWYADTQNQQLKLSDYIPTTNDIPAEYVFYFESISGPSISVNTSYKCQSGVGVWKSVSSDRYLGTATPYSFTSTSAQPDHYLICANGWDNSNGSNDIDMCHDYDHLFGYSNDYYPFIWGTNTSLSLSGQQRWKWQIYEVVYE